MVKQRIIETNEGIQDEVTIDTYDKFSKKMRDKSWDNIDSILNSGIKQGNVLEVGPGPGYVGLEWLKQSPGSTLTGCEISKNMINLASRNAIEYGLEDIVKYIEGNCMNMPFDDETFDGVFSNGSLHEWENPIKAINEFYRVLKPGRAFCITDMRRDSNPIIKWLIYYSTKPKEIRPGFLSSFNASYTAKELETLLNESKFKIYSVKNDFFGLCASGVKQ